MTPEELRTAVEADSIDTVVMAFADHYGRLVGKRFDAGFFLDTCLADGTHACDYLLTVDMEMEPVEGYASANWQAGYGDFHLVPDLDTLRRAGWTDGAALVLCDVEDDQTHEPVAVAPRSILRRQVDRLKEGGFTTGAASELEFFIFDESYRSAHEKDYRDLQAAGWYVEDYHLLQGARTEPFVRAARRALNASGVPVENSKGEAAIGQHELNIRWADVLSMADRHVVMKQALKELADQQERSITFMAKPDAAQPGNSCHLHLSLWQHGRNAFTADDGEPTDTFRWFLGGLLAHAPELMVTYAPTINSYKRFQDQSWAPTRLAWATDNRTAAFRVVGRDQSRRIECRLPGADVNPYLAYAAVIASGLDGIERRIEPPDELVGDGYASDATRLPTTLAAAAERFAGNELARRALGDDVVDHYAHFHRSEVAAFEAAVTDWEHRRYFERI